MQVGYGGNGGGTGTGQGWLSSHLLLSQQAVPGQGVPHVLRGHGQARPLLPDLLPAKAPAGNMSGDSSAGTVSGTPPALAASSWTYWVPSCPGLHAGPAAQHFGFDVSFLRLVHKEENYSFLLPLWLPCHLSATARLALGLGAGWGMLTRVCSSPPGGKPSPQSVPTAARVSHCLHYPTVGRVHSSWPTPLVSYHAVRNHLGKRLLRCKGGWLSSLSTPTDPVLPQVPRVPTWVLGTPIPTQEPAHG